MDLGVPGVDEVYRLLQLCPQFLVRRRLLPQVLLHVFDGLLEEDVLLNELVVALFEELGALLQSVWALLFLLLELVSLCEKGVPLVSQLLQVIRQLPVLPV